MSVPAVFTVVLLLTFCRTQLVKVEQGDTVVKLFTARRVAFTYVENVHRTEIRYQYVYLCILDVLVKSCRSIRRHCLE